MTDQYPFKSNTALPKPVTYKDGANIDIANGTIGVNPSPDFAGEVSAGKYNLQAGAGLTFDGLEFGVRAGAGLTSVTGAEEEYIANGYFTSSNFIYSTITDQIYIGIKNSSSDYVIGIFDRSTGNITGTLLGNNNDEINSMAISQDNNTLYAVGSSTLLYAINLTTGAVNDIIVESGLGITLAPNGTILYDLAGANHYLAIDLSINEVIATIATSGLNVMATGVGTSYFVFNTNGTLAYASGLNPSIPIIDMVNSTVIGVLNLSTPASYSAFDVIDSATNYLYSLSYKAQGTLTQYDLNTGTILKTLPVPAGMSRYADMIIYEPGSLAYILLDNSTSEMCLFLFDLVNFEFMNNGEALITTGVGSNVYSPSLLLGDEYYVSGLV